MKQKEIYLMGCHIIVSVLEYPSVTNKCLFDKDTQIQVYVLRKQFACGRGQKAGCIVERHGNVCRKPPGIM